MKTSARPRRSVLYMPGSNARALEKAKTIAADALILDLEDAVAPDAKEIARDQVAGAVSAGGYGQREIVIRVNGLDTPWGADDIKAAVAAGPDAVLVPKINSAHDLALAEEALVAAGAGETLQMWAMMETPRAMLEANAIATAGGAETSRLTVFVMGTNDLAKELRCEAGPARESLLPHLATSVAAARAHELAVIDGVYNDIKDEAGFAAEAAQGARLGFDGKTLIHPTQVEPANAAFSPESAEVERARQIIAAFELPENAGKGVVTVDGRMVELLHAEIAKRTVAVADAIAELEASA